MCPCSSRIRWSDKVSNLKTVNIISHFENGKETQVKGAMHPGISEGLKLVQENRPRALGAFVEDCFPIGSGADRDRLQAEAVGK